MQKLLKGAAVGSALALLTACTTVNPYTGEQQTSKAAKGAGIGALTGAVAGALSESGKDRRRAALKGAVLGGAVGGGIGYYMDVQEAKLRQQLEGTGVRVVRNGDVIQLVMPGNITFDTNSAAIRADFFSVLDSVALVLAEYDKTAIRISGHTDSTGSDSYNQRLSQQRAGSVGTYLSRKVDAGRIQAVGYGESSPVASNDTAAGRQQNRRVELELMPPAQL